MEAERGLVYKEADGSITLLRLNPARKMTLTLNDEYYASLPATKADIVEVGLINEVLQMTSTKAIRGITFYGHKDKKVPACEAIQYSLDNDPDALSRVLAEAEKD